MTTLRQIFKSVFPKPPEVVPELKEMTQDDLQKMWDKAHEDALKARDEAIANMSGAVNQIFGSPSSSLYQSHGTQPVFSGSIPGGGIAGIASAVGAVGMSRAVVPISYPTAPTQIHADVKSEYLARIDDILKRVIAIDKGSEKRDQVQEIRQKYIVTGVLTKDDMKFLNDVYQLLTVTNQLLKEPR